MNASILKREPHDPPPERFQPLLIALLISITVRPFLSSAIEPFVLIGLDAFLLIAGVWMASRKRWLLGITIAIFVLFTATNALFLTGVQTSLAWSLMLHAMLLGYILLVGGYALSAIMQARSVTADTIVGGICVYLLLAFFFAGAYSVLELLEEGSFVVGEALGGTSVHMTWVPVRVELTDTAPYHGTSDLLYYSFTTLTTLGFGDITPATRKASALTSLEAVTGQLYIAILIARLVGMHIAHRVSAELTD